MADKDMYRFTNEKLNGLGEIIKRDDMNRSGQIHYGCSWVFKEDGVWHVCSKSKTTWKVSDEQIEKPKLKQEVSSLQSEILTVREVSGNRLDLWVKSEKEVERLKAELVKVKRNRDFYQAKPYAMNVYRLTQKDRDFWKSRCARLEEALNSIETVSHTYGKGNEKYGINQVNKIAKEALAAETE